MTTYMFLKRAAFSLAFLAIFGYIPVVKANPLFARQTGLKCASCHTIYPELTPFGRKFKLGGYTLGERQKIPLALMAIVSRNSINDNTDKSTGEKIYGKNGDFALEAISLFSGGKFTDNAGGFIQWTYNNISTTDNQHFYGHSALDNTDLRLVKTIGPEEKSMLFGLTLHNNPTVQDVFNTTPAWSYPYYSPSLAAPGRGTQTFLESGARVAGVGIYSYLFDSLYLEGTSYQTAKGAFSVLRAGTPESQRISLSGSNPYWRIAYTFGDENQNLTLGHFGANVAVDVADGITPADRFRDRGFDVQYQFFSKDKHHIVTAHASVIKEKTDWRSGFPNGINDNPSSTLRSTRAKISYLYDRTYGITAGGFKVTGDADFARFGSTTGNPDTTGYILELNYWPTFNFLWDPQMNVRFGLQYTAYTKFNGSASNYDATLRDAKNNNTLYLYAWFMF
ncbi:MAG: cytochrome C [Polaromonas sp.]|uniref:cytochrome C n=1 Tax=Polaromonas sp. TaxID=1869339 RepID=UPI0017B14364|nr:cytochrome C [Polaromonas sp.]NMM10556.1 cytochrome C [Polaromonas sp.]